MKKRSSQKSAVTVGVDLGDRRSRLCVLDEAGEVIEEESIATSPSAFEEKFGQMNSSRVVIEAGTHSNWVHDVLVGKGHDVIVANTRQLRAVTANVRKSDEVDARLLAKLGRSDLGLIQPVRVKPQQARLDQGLLRARDALVTLRTALINTLRGLSKTAGHALPSTSSARAHKQTLDASLKHSLEPLLGVLEQLSKVIAEYDREIDRLCATRYPQALALQQISGVGPVTSLYFVLAIGDLERFKDARDVGAYFGLVPRRAQSGESDPQLRITKSGDRMGRSLLVQCAHYIIGPFGPDTDLRRFGRKLIERGGRSAKKRAIVATARKLAVLLFALLRSGEVYEPLRNSAKSKAS